MATLPQSLHVQLDQRESVSSELTRKLVDHLLRDGHLKPGERLPSERQLADNLGIGRSAIREALKSLAFLGLIEVRQGAGSYVKEPDSQLLPQVIEWGLLLGERKILDLVEARSLIEVAVAPLAAMRRDQSDLEAIERHLKRMSKARSTAEFVEGDIAFHLALADAARNSVFADILSSVQSLLRVWVTRVIDAGESSEPSYLEHLEVFKAVTEQDAPAARVAMQRHMDQASAVLRATLAQTEPASA